MTIKIRIEPAGLRKGAAIVVAGATLAAASPWVVDFISKWERDPRKPTTVYADKLANGLPTVCSGITKHVATVPVIVGEVWTEEKCKEQETQALTRVQLTLAKCFTRPPPQSVFDSATSHAWNFGDDKTCGSEAMKQWNLGNYALGCELLAYQYDGTTPNWSYVNGKFYRGLHNRRKAEMENCLKGVIK